MSNDLIPELKEIPVRAEHLFLDPNNPRFITKDDDRRDPSTAITHAAETQRRMEDGYKVDELKKSIRENGWIPVDYIFVQRVPGESAERYLVLEGNRRVTAIRGLLEEEDLDDSLRKSIETISVMEVIDDLPEAELKRKISYLLGVRHHGALKKWSPFAQAQNIYRRYLEVMGEAEFLWEESVASHVANALSLTLDEVRKRLQVYVAMQQLASHPQVIEGERNDARAGMKDRYYSVISEVANNAKRYASYIPIDQSTFTFEDAAADKMVSLCHFDKAGRVAAPINNPQQWRKLIQILNDEDREKSRFNIERVEVNKERPSDVWAERAAELKQLQWDKWLLKTDGVLRRVTLDDLDGDGAKDAAKRLESLLDELSHQCDEVLD
nr:hypothetical protein 7 [Halieaceae bacterium]